MDSCAGHVLFCGRPFCLVILFLITRNTTSVLLVSDMSNTLTDSPTIIGIPISTIVNPALRSEAIASRCEYYPRIVFCKLVRVRQPAD